MSINFFFKSDQFSMIELFYYLLHHLSEVYAFDKQSIIKHVYVA